MAIIEGVAGIEANIEVGGDVATEYQDSDPAEPIARKTAKRYVERMDRANFTVVCTVSADFSWVDKTHALLVRIDIDGEYATSYFARQPGERKIYKTGGVRQKNADTQKWSLQLFQFAPLTNGKQLRHVPNSAVTRNLTTIVDLMSHAGPGPILIDKPEYGMIRVTTILCTIGQEVPRRPGSFIRDAPLAVTEKEIKEQSVSHGTT